MRPLVVRIWDYGWPSSFPSRYFWVLKLGAGWESIVGICFFLRSEVHFFWMLIQIGPEVWYLVFTKAHELYVWCFSSSDIQASNGILMTVDCAGCVVVDVTEAISRLIGIGPVSDIPLWVTWKMMSCLSHGASFFQSWVWMGVHLSSKSLSVSLVYQAHLTAFVLSAACSALACIWTQWRLLCSWLVTILILKYLGWGMPSERVKYSYFNWNSSSPALFCLSLHSCLAGGPERADSHRLCALGRCCWNPWAARCSASSRTNWVWIRFAATSPASNGQEARYSGDLLFYAEAQTKRSKRLYYFLRVDVLFCLGICFAHPWKHCIACS